MNFLTRLNPAGSLYLRVFLGFWLAALLIFFSSVWLVKQLDFGVNYKPARPQHIKELKGLQQRLQARIDRRGKNVDLKQSMQQLQRRGRNVLLLIEPVSQLLSYSTHSEGHLGADLFAEFTLLSSPMFIETQGRTYLGPAKILVGPRPYLLFIGKPAPNRSLRMVRQEYPAVAVLFLLLFSGGLCYFFVRSILRPIVQLQNASKLMATGDLSARVGSASLRLDEIGQLGRDFNLMSVKVQSSLTSQKRLLADVSHELRSPLTRLQLSIGIAQQQSTRKLSEDTLRALQRIDKEALQIEAMIAQILTLSRLETQEASCDMERVTLGQIMAAAISDGQFEAQQQNKTLNYTPTTDLCFMAQPQLLISAIENVLRNAIYHSNKCIHISVEQKNSHISWSITDDGSGIDEQQLERVFEAFFRDPTKHTKAHKGTGLGLAIARQAVLKHQGTIRAKNNSQGGLTVIICLPFIDG